MSGLTENHKHVRRRLEPLRLATGKLSSPPPQSHVQEMPRICVSVVEAFGVQYRGGTIFDAGMDWTCGGKKSYLANRFVEECVRLSQLRHPNVVMLYGIVMDGPSLTLAMELPAANLDEILCHYNYIPEFMKTSMLLDAARGLLYLHKQKPTVAHNRVSTRAVYVSPSMSAKIGDVGVAGALCESTAENSATVGKMPPQALIKILETGTKYADTQVDVPAFGNVIVHTLCQRRWLDPPGHTALSPYLHTVPIHHPLYSLAYHCLLGGIQMSIQKPIPQVDMEYVVQCLQRAANDNPMPFTNTLELLQTLSLEVQRNGKHLKKNSTSMHQHNSSIHHGQDSTLPVSDVHKNFNEPSNITSVPDTNNLHPTMPASSYIPTKIISTNIQQYSPPSDVSNSSSHAKIQQQTHQSDNQYSKLIDNNSRHNSTGQVRDPPPKPPQRSSSFRKKSSDQTTAHLVGDCLQRSGSLRVKKSSSPPTEQTTCVPLSVTQQQNTLPTIKTATSSGGIKQHSLLLPSKFSHKEEIKQSSQSPQHGASHNSVAVSLLPPTNQNHVAVSLQPSSNQSTTNFEVSSSSEFEKLLARQREKIEAEKVKSTLSQTQQPSCNATEIDYLNSLKDGEHRAATDMDLPKKCAPIPPRRTSSFRSRQKYQYQSYSSTHASEIALRRHSTTPQSKLTRDLSLSSTSPSTGQIRPNSSADYQLCRLSGANLSETIFN